MNKKIGLVILAGLLVIGGCQSAEKTGGRNNSEERSIVEVAQGVKEVSPERVAELKSAIENAIDGQVIEISEGIYRDLGRVIIGANDVVVRAAKAGSVVFSGEVQLLIRGEGNTLESLVFRDGGAVISREDVDDTRADITGVVGIYGKNNTLKNSVIDRFNDYEYEADEKGKFPNVRWVTIGGEDNRVVNNTFNGKHKRGAILVVETSDRLEKAVIQGNIFRDIRPLDIELIEASNPAMARTNKNDRQAIRLGDSKNSQYPSESIIKDNLFEGIDGELEMISVKACNVVIEGNTVRNSASMISLRHGNAMEVRNNVILGDGKAGSGGIRFYDEDHIIENNYIEGALGYGNMRGGISVNTGVNDVLKGEKLDNAVKSKELSKQWTPRNVLIKNNTIVDSAQGILISDKTHKVSLTDNSRVEAVFPGVNIRFEENLVVAQGENTLSIKGAPSEKFELVDSSYSNNVFYGPRKDMETLPEGISDRKPEMKRIEGLLVTDGGLGASNLKVQSERTAGSTIKIK